MATTSGLRIGDSDREATAASLREHYAAGRLTLDEFHERLNATFAAKTDLDLGRITADLPHFGSYSAGAGGTGIFGYGPGRSAAPLAAGPEPWRTGARGASYHDHRSGRRDRRAGPGSAGRSRASVLASVIMIMIAITVVVAIAAPFALFGLWVSRPVIILLGIFAIARRMLRWLLRRPGGPRRRRWPI